MKKIFCAMAILVSMFAPASAANNISEDEAFYVCINHWGYGHPTCEALTAKHHTALAKEGPYTILSAAYTSYMKIKVCYEVRQGYDFVFISDVEMDKSKQYASTVEKFLAKPIPNPTEVWTKLQQWKEFQDTLSKIRTTADRKWCQNQYKYLQHWYEMVLTATNQTATKKDF